jgi:alpha-L-arabinofuranosidase
MQLWRNHYAPHRIEMTGETEALNAVATKSEDGKDVYVKCVNPGQSVANVTLNLTDEFTAKTARMQLVAPGALEARNTLQRPRSVRVEPGRVEFDKGSMRFALPAYSAAVVTIRL